MEVRPGLGKHLVLLGAPSSGPQGLALHGACPGWDARLCLVPGKPRRSWCPGQAGLRYLTVGLALLLQVQPGTLPPWSKAPWAASLSGDPRGLGWLLAPMQPAPAGAWEQGSRAGAATPAATASLDPGVPP